MRARLGFVNVRSCDAAYLLQPFCTCICIIASKCDHVRGYLEVRNVWNYGLLSRQNTLCFKVVHAHS